MIKATIPWNTKQIHKMVKNLSLVFDNAIQRGYVWDKNRQSLLIDSILRGYPIPPMYTIKSGRTVQTPKGNVAVFDALDGKQRCLTIARFKDNEFALTGIEDTIVDEDGKEIDLNGLTYDDLSESLKDAFDSFAINVVYFTDITDDEVVEIMARLNNGKPLSSAENTRIKARDLAGIRKLASHTLFTENFTEKAIDGYQNEDSVIKMYMLVHGQTGLDAKDVRPVYATLEVTKDVETEMGRILDRIDDVHAKLVDGGNKRVAKKIITRTNLVSIAPVVQKSIDEGKTVDELKDFLAQFFDEGKPSSYEEYNEACTNGTNHSQNVEKRIAVLDKEYDWYFGNK